MRKEIEIKVPYWDGEEKEKAVKISFISNSVNHDYNRLMDQVSSVQELQQELKRLQEDIGYKAVKAMEKLSIKGLKDARAEVRPLKEQLKKIAKQIKESDGKILLADRFALIKKILEQNKCTDPELLSLDFWNEKTEVETPWSFLHQAIMKDISSGGVKKKK